MLWDQSARSWRELGIRSQPAAILYSAQGKKLGQWQGIIDEDKVLQLIGA